MLPYSSGTTGLPKGVMLTHRQLVTACRQIARSIDADAHDVTLAVAPWFHILGMTAELLVPLTVGATVVTMPRFDPVGFLEAIERHRVTYVAVPPPVASFLAHHPSVAEHDLGSLELLASGGAPLPAATHEELARRLPGCAVGQGWGLTETSGAISVPRRAGRHPAGHGRHAAAQHRTAGRPPRARRRCSAPARPASSRLAAHRPCSATWTVRRPRRR